MKRYIMIMVLGLSAHAAYGLTTNEILGTWSVAIPTVTTNRTLGVIRWTSIQFTTNHVSWTWERDGKKENHSGRFRITADPVAKPGMHQKHTLTIIPTTFATTHAIVLKQVTHDLDNRFLYGTLVLKFKDEKGNWQVFTRKKETLRTKP